MSSLQTQSIPQGARDEDLISLASSGNALAFKRLMERHWEFVTRITARFLFREEDTHEVVQDTFIRVWKNLHRYDHRGLFTTWLYSIAFNQCLDRMRINRRRMEISLDREDVSHDFREESADLATTLDTQSIMRAIRESAGCLSLVQRQVFVLRDLHDLSVEEVCNITGYDSDNVKSNLYHARKKIREELTKGGYL